MSTKWENNALQFPRFIAEAEAAGAFTPEVVKLMAEGMDLQESDVVELIDRAQAKWDELKRPEKSKKISEARIYDPMNVKVKLLHMIETKFFALPPYKTYDAEILPDGRYRIHVNYNGEKDLVSVIVDKKSVKRI